VNLLLASILKLKTEIMEITIKKKGISLGATGNAKHKANKL
jgi:hypothetical protein